MDWEKVEQAKEKKQTWHCPICKAPLQKTKKGAAKHNVLPLGVRACHECESTWFLQKLNR